MKALTGTCESPWIGILSETYSQYQDIPQLKGIIALINSLPAGVQNRHLVCVISIV